MKLRALVGLVAILSANAIAQPMAGAIPDEVASWLKSYAASQTTFDGKTAYYYPNATRIAEGRLGAETAATVVFTLEGIRGGNDYLQYLGVFWKRQGHYVFCCARRVGGKGIRSVETVTVPGHSVRLSGNRYVPGTDPMCCPSKPYTTNITVVGSQLVDASRASNNRWSGP